jgi:general secretion pathway protein C
MARTANRHLPTVVTFALVVAIAYELSRLTWAFPGAVPITSPPSQPSQTTAVTTPSSSHDTLAAGLLFGPRPKEALLEVAQGVVDAPDTTLGLTLSGILALGSGPDGHAIISTNRGQENYHVGQAIDGANGATLHAVYADRVLLDRGDRLETLRLPQELLGAAGAPARASSPMAPAAAPRGDTPRDSLRNVISQNASRLTDIVQPAVHVQGGRVIGFRVNPGRDRESFEALGLLPGDIVTDINGVLLNDASRGVQAFAALGEATTANVTVLREGVPMVLVIDTSQLQDLEENRE